MSVFIAVRDGGVILPRARISPCPSGARIFGDLSDPNSEVSKLLKKYKGTVLKPEAGTEPNVYYIRSFAPANAG